MMKSVPPVQKRAATTENAKRAHEEYMVKLEGRQGRSDDVIDIRIDLSRHVGELVVCVIHLSGTCLLQTLLDPAARQ